MSPCHVVGDEVKRLCLQIGVLLSMSCCHVVGDEVKKLFLKVGICQAVTSSLCHVVML